MSALDRDLTLTLKSDLFRIIQDTQSLKIRGVPINVFKTVTGLKTLDVAFDNINRPDIPNLKVLLRILEKNLALEKVWIKSEEAFKLEVEQPLETPINLPQLKFLSLTFNRWRDAEYMISRIRIPKNEEMDVEISCPVDVIPLEDALKSIGGFSSSLIHVEVDWVGTPTLSILSRENGKLFLSPVPSEDICTALEGGFPLFPWQNVERLDFEFGRRLPKLSAKASLFTALKTITADSLGSLYRREDEKRKRTGPLEEFARSLNMYREKTSADGPKIWRKSVQS